MRTETHLIQGERTSSGVHELFVDLSRSSSLRFTYSEELPCFAHLLTESGGEIANSGHGVV